MDRRKFLLGAMSAMAACQVGGERQLGQAPHRFRNWLYEVVADENQQDVRHGDLTGELTGSQHGLLADFFDFICSSWGSGEQVSHPRYQFDWFISEKTDKSPSYFTEYVEAAQIIERATSVYGRSKEAYQCFFDVSADSASLRNTRIGCAHRFVASEFVAWFMAMGGFERFGYQNYRGYFGGSYAMNPPPYRVTEYASPLEIGHDMSDSSLFGIRSGA